jgi:hypothetical protein
MASEEIKLQVDDDPVFDDSDLYDNDNGAEIKSDTDVIIKPVSVPEITTASSAIQGMLRLRLDVALETLNQAEQLDNYSIIQMDADRSSSFFGNSAWNCYKII